jgi:hypothetical protein
MAAAGLFMVLLLAACYIRLPDYRIYKVFSYSGLNVRETDLYVIVYKPWRIDHEVQGIVSQHNEMNGTPDKLTVWLYYSKYNIFNYITVLCFICGKEHRKHLRYGRSGNPSLS